MNSKTNFNKYSAPIATVIDILPESVICQSSGYDVTLEDMKENDYTFTF